MKGLNKMKKKFVIGQVVSTAIGCGIGVGISVLAGSFVGVIAGVAVGAGISAVATNKMADEPVISKEAPLVPAPVKADRSVQNDRAALLDELDKNILEISEEVSFAAQQLIWGMREIGVALGKIDALANQVSNQSINNATHLEEATANVAEIASAANQVSETAASSLEKCKSSTSLAAKHRNDINEVSAAIKNVGAVVKNAVDSIDELNKASEEITSFVEKIRGIASQTNLLSLNAAIEAARAGEHGKGFAVVAEEVRKLATDSEETTKEIEHIVKSINDTTANVTERMKQGSDSLQTVENLASESAAAMHEMVEDINTIESVVGRLCSMSTRQRDTTDEMSKVIENIGHSTTKIAGSTKETSERIAKQQSNMGTLESSISNLNNISRNLHNVALEFKKPNELSFSLYPMKAPEVIREIYVPIIERAMEKIGYKARCYMLSEDEVERDLIRGHADFSWLTPSHYVSVREQVNITPMVTPAVDGATSYNGFVFVRKDSPYHTLEDLKGARFGFVHKKSASGYACPKAAMLEAGKDPDKFFGTVRYMGSHESVIEAVQKGELDAGATYAFFLVPGSEEQMRIIFETGSIPKESLVAGAHIKPELVKAMTKALQQVTPDDPVAGPGMRHERYSEMAPINDEAYDVVRKANKVIAES